MAGEIFGDAILRRVEWLTLLLGAAGTIWADWRWGWRGALGLALGAILSWINFRWLKGGVRGFGGAAGDQAGSMPANVPWKAFAKFFGRFLLLLGAVYVILTYSSLLVVAVFTGLFASAAGVVLGLIYELVFSSVRQGASKNG
jgi:ascorbate-specific PTS system EIIC-type component UlaA